MRNFLYCFMLLPFACAAPASSPRDVTVTKYRTLITNFLTVVQARKVVDSIAEDIFNLRSLAIIKNNTRTTLLKSLTPVQMAKVLQALGNMSADLGGPEKAGRVLDIFLDVFFNNLSGMITAAQIKAKAMKAARKPKPQILYQVNLIHSKFITPAWVKTMFTRWKGRLTPAEWNSVLKHLSQIFLLAKYFPVG